MATEHAQQELLKFERDLDKTTFRQIQRKDEHFGTRYSVKVEEGALKLPHVFTRLGRMDVQDAYMYLLPETPDDPEFEILIKAVNALERKVRRDIKAKNYTAIVKNPAMPSVNVKLYHDKSKKITSKLMTNTGTPIAINDSRMESRNQKKILYCDILVDSVYVTKDETTHISFKLAEACVYFYRNENTLDLELVQSLRNLKVGNAEEEE